ncbi:MAG: VCBS repeat-containing protein, partial [Bacteroidota bacterium]
MRKILFWLGVFLALASCQSDSGTRVYNQFEEMTDEQTGLVFENVLQQTTEFNVFEYMYFFNGGGVGVGDFNNDGKEDLYFSSNMGDNALFLNQGDMRFEEVTKEAGVEGIPGWSSGVSVVDINNDGMLDIYVSQVSGYSILEGHNQLFVCDEIV